MTTENKHLHGAVWSKVSGSILDAALAGLVCTRGGWVGTTVYGDGPARTDLEPCLGCSRCKGAR